MGKRKEKNKEKNGFRIKLHKTGKQRNKKKPKEEEGQNVII